MKDKWIVCSYIGKKKNKHRMIYFENIRPYIFNATTNKHNMAAIYIPWNDTVTAFCLVFIVLSRLERIHSHVNLQHEAHHYKRAAPRDVWSKSPFRRSVIPHMDSRDKGGRAEQGGAGVNKQMTYCQNLDVIGFVL